MVWKCVWKQRGSKTLPFGCKFVVTFWAGEPLSKGNFSYRHCLKLCRPPNESLGPPEQKRLAPFRQKLLASGLKMRLKTKGSYLVANSLSWPSGPGEPLSKGNFGYRHCLKLCRPPNESLDPPEQKRLAPFRQKLLASGLKMRLKTKGFKNVPIWLQIRWLDLLGREAWWKVTWLQTLPEALSPTKRNFMSTRTRKIDTISAETACRSECIWKRFWLQIRCRGLLNRGAFDER